MAEDFKKILADSLKDRMQIFPMQIPKYDEFGWVVELVFRRQGHLDHEFATFASLDSFGCWVFCEMKSQSKQRQ